MEIYDLAFKILLPFNVDCVKVSSYSLLMCFDNSNAIVGCYVDCWCFDSSNVIEMLVDGW